MQRRRQIDALTIIVLFVLGLGWRAFILRLQPPFDGLYGQDGYAYFDFAGQLRAFVATGQLPEPFFWPWGYPILLAIGQTVGISGQAINILLGSTLPILNYVLARQIGLRWFGCMSAGLLVLVCGQAVQSSLVVMSDIPALFWAMLSAIALMRFCDRGKGGWLVMAACFLALAIITRWLYLLLILPWGVLVLNQRLRWRVVALVATPPGVLIAAQLWLSQSNRFPTLGHEYVTNWSVTNAFQHTLTSANGQFTYALPNIAFYAQPFHDVYYLAPIMTPFVIIGLLSLILAQRYALNIFLSWWALLPYVFLIGIPFQNIRFPLIVFPAVTLLTGIGFDTIQQQIRWRVPVTIVLGALLLFSAGLTLQASRPIINQFITRQQQDKEAVAWMIQRMPRDATVYAFGLTLTLQHYYPEQDVRELYYETPQSLAENWRRGRADYLVLNADQVEHQWANTTLYDAFQWFWDERGLIFVGRQSGYSLFYVQG